MKFVREPRYCVFKWTDMIATLSRDERKELVRLGNKVHEYRIAHGKRPFQCAVVEDDWPEFEMVWAAIEKRMTTIDTGDTVIHTPTCEEWLVAFVENDTLCCCGWPATLASVKDCVLTEKATPEARDALLRRLEDLSQDDPRRRYARNRLTKEMP